MEVEWLASLARPHSQRRCLAAARFGPTTRTWRLSVAFEGLFPATVRTDPTRLRQILINLVGNALKFTASGSVTVTSSPRAPAHVLAGLQFDVADTGIGLYLPSKWRGSSSRFRRPMLRARGIMAEQDWGWQSAANWRGNARRRHRHHQRVRVRGERVPARRFRRGRPPPLCRSTRQRRLSVCSIASFEIPRTSRLPLLRQRNRRNVWRRNRNWNRRKNRRPCRPNRSPA